MGRVLEEQRRLDREEDAKAKVRELQGSLSKQLSRLQRVWEQKQFLKDRGVRLAVQGFASLEEMEEEERKEQKQAQTSQPQVSEVVTQPAAAAREETPSFTALLSSGAVLGDSGDPTSLFDPSELEACWSVVARDSRGSGGESPIVSQGN